MLKIVWRGNEKEGEIYLLIDFEFIKNEKVFMNIIIVQSLSTFLKCLYWI